MTDDTTRTNPDLERLLSDYGATYRFPPTPDIASAVEARLNPNGRSGNLAERSTLGLRTDSSRRAPASRDDRSLGLIAMPSRRARSRQLLELVAGLVIFAIVAGLLTLAFRGVAPESESNSPGATFVPDGSYALYITGGPQDQRELLPLDPWTLADSETLSRTGRDTFGGTLSADGSTHVTIEYGAESSNGENLAAEDLTIIVSDGLTGAERARFHPPAHVVFAHLSADGSRLAVRHRRGYGETISPTWYLLNTADGSLIGTVSWERDDLPGNRVLISPDATRLYKASWQTVGALGPFHPEIGSLTLTSYDLTTGEELARQEYADIPAGGWALDPEAGEDSDIASYEPAVELSPDGERIVVAHADAELITLIDSDDLQIDRVISLSDSAGWMQKFLTWAGMVPQDTAAKGAAFTESRSITFSPDDRYLYLWGITSMPDGGQIVYSGIGLTVVDLDRGEITAGILDDKRIELVQPAPDGEALFVAWFKSDERPLPFGATLVLQRLDAGTLEVQAEREFVGYRRIVIDPTADVVRNERSTANVHDSLRVTYNWDTRRQEMLPVDPTTKEPLSGYEPISLGHHYTHAFSPDGRTMAAMIWPSQSGERGELHLVDLTDWTVTATGVNVNYQTDRPMYSINGQSLYWILPTTTHLKNAISGPRAYELHRYDLETGSQETVVSFPETFIPFEAHMVRAGTRLAIWGESLAMDNITYGPPQVIVIDLESDDIISNLELPEVKLRQADESYQPGLAWDLERGLLYIAHADEDRITVVDLAEGVVNIQSDILRPRSHVDRFVDWLIPSAAAKGGPVTIRRALLSDDGRMLYIAPLFGEYETIDEPDVTTDLLIVETERLEEVGRFELGTIVDVQLTPNGRNLLVRSFDRISTKAGHRLTKIDPITGDVLGQLALPEPDADGVVISGFNQLDITDTEATLRVQYGAPESHHVEAVRIDLETLTILSQEVVEDEVSQTFIGPD